MRKPSIGTLLIAGLSMGTLGCDAIVRGTQDITLTIKLVDGGALAADARVRCAPWSHCPAGGPSTIAQSEYVDRHASDWAPIDRDGSGTVRLRTLSGYGGFPYFLLPPLTIPSRPRDEVTGVEHLFQIESNGSNEVLAVVVEPGAAVRGDRFVLAVDGIGEPQPLPRTARHSCTGGQAAGGTRAGR